MKNASCADGSGWAARFDDEASLAAAAAAMREAGFVRWNVFSPYPVRAAREVPCGRRSRRGTSLSCWGTLGGLSGGLLVAGWLAGTQLRWGDPLVNQGRAPGADLWFGYVPFVLEGILLGAGLAIVAGFLCVTRLPRLSDRVVCGRALSSDATSQGLFIVADASCGEAARDLLLCHGAVDMEWIGSTPEEGGCDG